MKEKIRVAILGYGNLGKGVEKALCNPANSDMKLVGIFTRRDPKLITPVSDVPVRPEADLYGVATPTDIDVLILCGGSATDLPVQGPKWACAYNIVDSFDTHAKIPEYLDAMNTAGEKYHKVSIISVGWDPGIFSIERAYAGAFLPDGETYTFWGKGVSQGHSDAIRRITGVKDAKQYTVPVQSAIDRVRSGENPELSTREKHDRVCYVVIEEAYDNNEERQRIADEISNMPNYFADYNTAVHFISEEEFKEKHSAMPHGGVVIRSGNTGENKQIIEHSLKLDSNPEFTGSVLVAYARAAAKLYKSGQYGAKTVLDIPPAWLYNDEMAKSLPSTLL